MGLQTSDDLRFVRAFWEVPTSAIARSRKETDGLRWAPFAKGGEYSPYYSDVHLVVDWEADGKRLRSFQPAKVQGAQYYFKPGLTWPERTVSAFAAQILPAGTVFSVKGPLFLPTVEGDPFALMAWLNGRMVRWVIESSAAAGEETKKGGTAARDYSVGLLQRLPWPDAQMSPKVSDELSAQAAAIAELRARRDSHDETSRRFVCPAVLCERDGTLRDRVAADAAQQNADCLAALERHAAIDERLLTALGAGPDVALALDEAVGPLVASLPERDFSTEENERLFELSMASMSELVDAASNVVGMSRWARLSSHIVDRRLELLALVFQTHPRSVVTILDDHGWLRPDHLRGECERFVSWVVGVAFGRWSVEVGRDPSSAPPQTGLLDPVALSPPGALVDERGLPSEQRPPGYPLELPSPRILVDDEGARWDLASRVRAAASAALGDCADEILDQVEGVLKQGLRAYLRRRFFRDHLARYSKSRRKAPIYWQLSVPSRAWSTWIYAPALSREMLYAVAREASRRRQVLTESIEQLRVEGESASGRQLAQIEKRREGVAQLSDELRGFAAEAERVAGLGWTPDLNDGLVLCAAPLADLFPAWPDAKRARDELRERQHGWATVAKWAEAL